MLVDALQHDVPKPTAGPSRPRTCVDIDRRGRIEVIAEADMRSIGYLVMRSQSAESRTRPDGMDLRTT